MIQWFLAASVYTKLNRIMEEEQFRSFLARYGPRGPRPEGDIIAELYIDIVEDTAAAELDRHEAFEETRVRKTINANQCNKEPGPSDLDEATI